MSLQTDIQSKVTDLMNRIGTPVKIVKNSGLNEGKSKTTNGILTDTTADDLADTLITITDKILYIGGKTGLTVDAGDTIEFVKSRNVYTVLKTAVYNIDDVVANNMAVKIYIRP